MNSVKLTVLAGLALLILTAARPAAAVCIPADCDDGNACTDDSCSAGGGFVCEHTPTVCDDGNACTDDDCDSQTGCFVSGPTVCNDGDPCTDDACDSSTGCFATAKNCDDSNACTTDTCDRTGECVHTPVTGLPPETPPECGDAIDNDCDGLIDCADPGCGPAVCVGGTKNNQSICNTEQGQTDCTSGGGKCQCPGLLKDPTKITFGRNGAPDVIRSHARVLIDGSVDVGHTPVTWLLSDQSGAIYQVGLNPGQMTSNQKGTAFKYKNAGARTTGGVYSAQIRISHLGTSYGYKLIAYGDMSKAVDPNMDLQFYLGQPTSFIHSEVWKRTKTGWVAHGAE